LIALKEWRPLDVHPHVWAKLQLLIKDDRLIAPRAVLGEIKRGDDSLVRWANRQGKRMFRRHSHELIGHVQAILAQFPNLVDEDQPGNSADPYVVALALMESRSLEGSDTIVVTEEKFALNATRIPQVCQAYNLAYLNVHQMFLFEKSPF
jgi:hypothetical protein